MSDLPEPHFIDRDPAQIRREIRERYEELSERTLSPGQFEAQVLEILAYRESLARISIQDAALQNLPGFARFPMIDHLARIVGEKRLSAQPARTTMRFALEAALGIPTAIPKATRIRTKDGRVEFETDDDAMIDAGETEVTALASARVTGQVGNGYAPGQVSQIVEDLGADLLAENVTETRGGTAQEGTERLRVRIPLAVRSLSVAGPEDAYRYHALSAHPDVVDVSVTTPEPGVVRVVVLGPEGAPSPELLAAVEAVISSPSVRPLCDTVEVVGATPVDFALEARVTLRRGAPHDATLALAEASAATYVESLERALGLAPVKSQIIAALSAPAVPGIYSVDLMEPALPVVVNRGEWARCVHLEVLSDGYEVGA